MAEVILTSSASCPHTAPPSLWSGRKLARRTGREGGVALLDVLEGRDDPVVLVEFGEKRR
ncbi:hypothetical protein [Streptomyces sp. NPDC007355]|uniref:hypothetical protein n=1 Tax=Streptomyces sp. NPDC007355 TaxID=3364778 RepID=UPI00369956C4